MSRRAKTLRSTACRSVGLNCSGRKRRFGSRVGPMCNFVAVKVHTRPADAIVADWMAHIIRAESAGAAFSSGVLVEPIQTERGIFNSDQLEAALARLRTAPSPYLDFGHFQLA